MTKKDITNIVNVYYDKICKHYGYSKYQESFPYLSIEDSPYSDADEPNLIGEYCSDENELIVYWKNIKSTEELIRTLIHEYQHYLQSPVWMTRYYNMGCDYHTHPYEVIAYAKENEYNLFYENERI